MKLAIFDIDGTLVNGASERRFWRFLARRGRQGPRHIAAYLLFMLRYLPTGGIHTLKKNKAYLFGLRVEDVEGLARDFVAERLMDELYEPAVRRLKAHLSRGDIVVLMSGTLHCVARALGDALGVRHVCATIASERNGVYLAQPPEVHPFDAAKLSLMKQIVQQFGIDMRQVTAYGDSRHDIFLLAEVGEPVAVRPDPALRRVANALGWEVICEQPLAGTHTLPSEGS
jgi:HAD superfamily hydrolase (TIGR01490 family)